MGGGFGGHFVGTKGADTAFTTTTKADAIRSADALSPKIRKSVKAFFRGSSNHYDGYSVAWNRDGTFTVKMENPGRVPGSKAVYCKMIDENGVTTRVYKETYDPAGKLVHTKEK